LLFKNPSYFNDNDNIIKNAHQDQDEIIDDYTYIKNALFFFSNINISKINNEKFLLFLKNNFIFLENTFKYVQDWIYILLLLL
jgi:hypothetical protein